MDLSGQNLEELPLIPEGVVKLDCCDNKITKIENLPESLRELKCANNLITNLNNLPSLLKILRCADNKITKLDNLPQSLEILVCDGNQLTKLPKLPITLEELCCTDNKLKNLSECLVNCESLIDLEYDENMINNDSDPSFSKILISFDLRRAIKNIKNYYYSAGFDRRNEIEASIYDSVINIKKDKVILTEEELEELLENDEILTIRAKNLIYHDRHMSKYYKEWNITYNGIFTRVWQRITAHDKKDEMKKVLNDEIINNKSHCFVEKLYSLMKCLVEYCDDVDIKMSGYVRISEMIKTLKEISLMFGDYNVEACKAAARLILKEKDYDDDVINNWIRLIK